MYTSTLYTIHKSPLSILSHFAEILYRASDLYFYYSYITWDTYRRMCCRYRGCLALLYTFIIQVPHFVHINYTENHGLYIHYSELCENENAIFLYACIQTYIHIVQVSLHVKKKREKKIFRNYKSSRFSISCGSYIYYIYDIYRKSLL